MKYLLAPFIFVIHTSLQISNLALWGSLVILCGLIKLALPLNNARRWLAELMHGFMFCFGKLSVGLIRLFNPIKLEYRIHGDLSRQNWYLIVANHLSYLDIILLIEFAGGRIPAPKFFLKQELIWLPFVGLGAWALDMPFMRRYSKAYLQKHPHKKGKDIETTKRYCQKFKTTPTTVINFVEGTRFTPKKHQAKSSPFQYLLPPKAGGVAFTLATMGNLFTNILDISLLYPQNSKHPMMAMLSGQMREIIVDVNVIDVPEQAMGDYFSDEEYRGSFQNWLNGLWEEKDQRIGKLLEQ
ncbi:acyltransferase [Alteromonas aestuariivivens]|uniref:Acyltransferase n=1 Tax=Alteromonas aestuariivivens TaxID=1938339 RepID=A0A3D8M317_9ALTE|nr:acyltransferase [Alteromonas aestuariivivens]RDV24006.1 acyltransferase [Alteromonas aestuariivivens]